MDQRDSNLSFLLYILNWTGFLVILLTTVYNKYIDRPELTEQNEPVEHVVSPSIIW